MDLNPYHHPLVLVCIVFLSVLCSYHVPDLRIARHSSAVWFSPFLEPCILPNAPPLFTPTAYSMISFASWPRHPWPGTGVRGRETSRNSHFQAAAGGGAKMLACLCPWHDVKLPTVRVLLSKPQTIAARLSPFFFSFLFECRLRLMHPPHSF